MKKVTKILFSLVIVFSVCIGSVNMSFATIKQDQQRAVSKYHQFLKGKSGYYAIVDINGDNVKDLLWKDTKEEDYMGSRYYKIYTYRYGKLKCIKKFMYAKGGNMYYNTKTHKVIMERCYFTGKGTYVYKIKKTSTKLVKHLEYSNLFNENHVREECYKINGKKVSKSTFNKSLSYAKRGCKEVTRTI